MLSRVCINVKYVQLALNVSVFPSQTYLVLLILFGFQISELKQKVQESESLVSALQQTFSQAKRNTQEQMVWPNTLQSLLVLDDLQ